MYECIRLARAIDPDLQYTVCATTRRQSDTNQEVVRASNRRLRSNLVLGARVEALQVGSDHTPPPIVDVGNLRLPLDTRNSARDLGAEKATS